MRRFGMSYLLAFIVVAVTGAWLWNSTARGAYESAEYSVVEKEGEFEVRDYPDLMLASTTAKVDAQGRDGSFMRLFRYISGNNESGQKIAMTTPVFMEPGDANSAAGTRGKMGFVIPKDVVAEGTPDPVASEVSLKKRAGGRFAVIRFSGRMNAKLARSNETLLREWIESKGLKASDVAETAGYDAPFTPGPLRRNEVLIRLK